MSYRCLDKYIPFTIFFIFFLIYLHTVFPAVPPRDSAELIAVSANLGIAHPPGYPLYALLGKIFITLFPLANAAYRINLMSAFFGAASLSLLFLLLRKNNISLIVALTAVCFLGFNPFYIKGAVAAEVFSLNAFLAILLIYTFLFYKNLALFSFLLGLGLGNHHTLILLLPGILLFFIALRRDKYFSFFSTSTFTCLFLFFLLGLSIYLYLPLRSQQSPLLNWGRPDNLKNFYRVLTRADYGSFKLTDTSIKYNFSSFIRQLYQFFRNFTSTFSLLGVLLALIGIIYLWIVGKKSFLFWILIFFFTGPILVIWANLPSDWHHQAILERFYILPGIIFSCFIGWGIEQVKKIGKDMFPLTLTLIFLFTYTFTCFAIKNLSINSQRLNFIPYDLARNIFRIVEPKSFLAVSGDSPQFLLMYLQVVERKRRDLNLLPETWVSPWGLKEIHSRWPEAIPHLKGNVSIEEFLNKFFQYNYSRYPIYLLGFKRVERFQAAPFGLIDKILLEKNNLVKNLDKAKITLDYLLVTHGDPIHPPLSKGGRGDFRTGDYFTIEILEHYSIAYNRLGIAYLGEGLVKIAMDNFKKAIELNPEDSQAHNNLGSAYFRMENYQSAISEFKQSITLDPANAEACNNLGSVYGVLQDYTRAAKMFEQALKINPNFELARKNYQLAKQKVE